MDMAAERVQLCDGHHVVEVERLARRDLGEVSLLVDAAEHVAHWLEGAHRLVLLHTEVAWIVSHLWLLVGRALHLFQLQLLHVRLQLKRNAAVVRLASHLALVRRLAAALGRGTRVDVLQL